MIRAAVAVLLLLWQAPEPVTFEAQTNLVPIETEVRNSLTLLPISGLTREDFVVVDESKEASIRVFDPTSIPLNIVLLVDVGGDSLNEGILFTTDALVSLLKPDDRIALVSFGARKTQIRTGLTNDTGQIRAARNQIMEKDRDNKNVSSDHTSRLLDAISQALELFPKSQNVRRPALVVITHNREGHSTIKKEAVMQSLLSSGVMLNAITIPQQLREHYTVAPRSLPDKSAVSWRRHDST